MTDNQDEQNLDVSKETVAQLIGEVIDTVSIGDRNHSMPIVECYDEYDIYVSDNNELTIRIAPPDEYYKHAIIDELDSINIEDMK
jgi:hypothetical protein